MVRGLFFVALLGGAVAEPPQTAPKTTGSSDIPELKPLLWKHSGRKVHDPWKQYCGSTYCYDVLEVPKDATKQQITKSYHKLSREWHPDKVSFLILHVAVSFFSLDPPPSTTSSRYTMHQHPEKKVADAKFKLIARAYEIVGKGQQEREYYDFLMNNPREYRKKYGEHFFKSLPPQTSMPLVLLLMLLVFSGIHYMMLKHKQGEYNAAVMKICFENRGPKDDGTKASQEVHKRAKDLLKQRLQIMKQYRNTTTQQPQMSIGPRRYSHL